MGLFGPTKKGGGLDMRYSSNKGGYTGKILGGLGSFLDDDDDGTYESYQPDLLNDPEHRSELLNSIDVSGDTESILKNVNKLFIIKNNSRSFDQEDIDYKIEMAIFNLSRAGADFEAKFIEKKLNESKNQFKSKKRSSIIALLMIGLFLAIMITLAINGYLD